VQSTSILPASMWPKHLSLRLEPGIWTLSIVDLFGFFINIGGVFSMKNYQIENCWMTFVTVLTGPFILAISSRIHPYQNPIVSKNSMRPLSGKLNKLLLEWRDWLVSLRYAYIFLKHSKSTAALCILKFDLGNIFFLFDFRVFFFYRVGSKGIFATCCRKLSTQSSFVC